MNNCLISIKAYIFPIILMQYTELQVTAHFLRLESPEYNTVNVTSNTIFISALMILFLFFYFLLKIIFITQHIYNVTMRLKGQKKPF